MRVDQLTLTRLLVMNKLDLFYNRYVSVVGSAVTHFSGETPAHLQTSRCVFQPYPYVSPGRNLPLFRAPITSLFVTSVLLNVL